MTAAPGHAVPQVPDPVAVLPPLARFSLRIGAADRPAAAAAFGLALPERIGAGAAAEGRAAWCLGPDEWLLHAPEAAEAEVAAAFAACRAAAPHSLTVISDREITLGVAGPGVCELLSLGCPADPALLAPGQARRSVFDDIQIVLIRDAAEAFRIEVGRSFADHVQGVLETGRLELAAGL
jgi:sarcosine oxidase subunit gamma